jgi:hypothetical protein
MTDDKNRPTVDPWYAGAQLVELKKLGASKTRDVNQLLVICVKYYRIKRPFPALKGRATLFIPDFRMLLNEVHYFEKDGKRWIRLPQYDSGHQNADGDKVYKSYVKFTCKTFTRHFYQQAIDAIALKIEADALIQLGKMMKDPLYTPKEEGEI